MATLKVDVRPWTSATDVEFAGALASGTLVFARRFQPPFPGLRHQVDLLIVGQTVVEFSVSAVPGGPPIEDANRVPLERLRISAVGGGGDDLPLRGFGFWSGD